MSSSTKTQIIKASGRENLSKNPVSGMSLKEARRHLGIDVTERQFRRYVNEGVIPAAKLAKDSRGWWVLVSPPQTENGWQQLAARIQKWRESRYGRGWQSRPRARKKPSRKSEAFGELFLENIHMDFLRWKSRSEADGYPSKWNEDQHKAVLKLLRPMAEVINTSIAAVRALSKRPQRLQ